MVPEGTSLSLAQLRSKVAASSAPSKPSTSPPSAVNSPPGGPISAGLNQRPSEAPAAQLKTPGQPDKGETLSEDDLLAGGSKPVGRGSAPGDRVPLTAPGQHAATANAAIQDAEGHREASRAFMDSVAGNVGMASEPPAAGDASSLRDASAGCSFAEVPSSSDVVSLDDIIADIQQQQLDEDLAGPSEAGAEGTKEASQPGIMAEDPGMSREAQANTASAAVAPLSTEAIPGTSAGQSMEFQTGSAAVSASAASPDTSLTHQDDAASEPGAFTKSAQASLQQVLEPGQHVAADLGSASGSSAGQQTKPFAAGSAASSKDRSGSSAAPECMLTNGFKVLASPTAVPSQSRETRASTQSAASTVASTESLPSISAGQSREFQADSQMSSTSDSYSPEEFRVLEPDARNLSSTDDSSQSRETRASTQSAASTMASTESIPGTSAGQSRDFQAVSSSASVPEASGIQDQPAAGQSPASRPVAGASQSREPQAAMQSAVSTAASSESIPDSSAGQSRDFQSDTNAFNSNPGPHQQQSPGASMPATARQSRPAGFPEPPPLPSSFKLRPGSSPPQQPRANGASSRPLSATPAGIHADVNGRSTSGRGNEFPATIGPAPGSSPPWIGKTAGGSSSTSRMRDYAASIGAGPGSSPYERRSGPGKKTAARPFPNASGAGEGSVGADSLSSSSSRGVVPISGMPGDKATDPLPGNTDNSLSSAGESSSSMLGGHARSRQPSQLKSRRAGSNVWDPNEPDFVGFPDHDRVVRGGELRPGSVAFRQPIMWTPSTLNLTQALKL